MANTTPQYHCHLGRLFHVSAAFPDTAQGTRDANEHMACKPGVGVIATEAGVIMLSSDVDNGAADYAELLIKRLKAGAVADRWSRHGEVIDGKLIMVDASRRGSFTWHIGGDRQTLAQVRAFIIAAAERGQLTSIDSSAQQNVAQS